MTHPITLYFQSLATHLRTGSATEHTHRGDLQRLFEASGTDIIAINEPNRIVCGAPDLAIQRGDFIVGHIECKDVAAPLDTIESSEQLQRYRRALENLILTDYLEFRWYVNGDLRRSARLARVNARGELQLETNGRDALESLIADFLAQPPQSISSPRILAERMARLTHLIRDIIINAFQNDLASSTLVDWRDAFARVLIPELDQPENLGQFADMFAQTLSYGLFSARIMHQTGPFNRLTAQENIPRTNPFLRDFFTFITGPSLNDEPYAEIVDDLIQLLHLADMHAILSDFGAGARQDDPMMHFYETFLAAYDPQLREKRGVYFTPMPVVSFIVRSVDELLKTRFDLPDGLADTSRLPDGTHRVLVLDPAVGTATFLYAVIDLIREEFRARNDAGMWSGYVREHLLDRIFGFELMMAPYAVAHFKLAMQLAGLDLDLPEEERKKWAYDFQSDDRIRVYLTNTLEALGEDIPQLFGPAKFVAAEARAADAVKQEKPIMVVLGNPPYSKSSSNKGEHIEQLMDLYKEAVRDERNIMPLSDDYIKFIRFAHDRIERTGYGIVGLITNHKFLNGLIQKGVRENLLKTFNEILILNLHGNTNIAEIAPNGEIDENVFDIKQGVAISLFIKSSESNQNHTVKYTELWGTRESKYNILASSTVSDIHWKVLKSSEPNYYFVPKDLTFSEDYREGITVDLVFNLKSSGVKTHRDNFAIDFESDSIIERVKILRDIRYSTEEIRRSFNLNNTQNWNLEIARSSIMKDNTWQDNIRNYLYRPFDFRMIYYSSSIIDRTRFNLMRNFNYSNIALIADRTTSTTINFNHVLVSNTIVDVRSIPDYGGAPFVFPIYLYPEENLDTLFDSTATSAWAPDPAHGNRVPNLDSGFVAQLEAKLGLTFDPHLAGRDHAIQDAFGPEDILAYIYAIFHNPTYRERYAEFLKIDFPRVPLTSDPTLFRRLVGLGRELLALHLMESPRLNTLTTHFPNPGDNTVGARGGWPQYTPPEGETGGRVSINREQYFEGVPPEVWTFEIGGYQVLHKWLKDRRGRELSYDERRHYQQVVVSLTETIRLMAEIDAAVPTWPLT